MKFGVHPLRLKSLLLYLIFQWGLLYCLSQIMVDPIKDVVRCLLVCEFSDSYPRDMGVCHQRLSRGIGGMLAVPLCGLPLTLRRMLAFLCRCPCRLGLSSLALVVSGDSLHTTLLAPMFDVHFRVLLELVLLAPYLR